ncbi:type VI secretion system tip protein TssI/VgrG [Pseudomonas viridiflava]|uniref:Type VI secretion system tip protein TssI/VgrG n=7 Tax=Pseudomonas viridiflava TaxID=33069 RepID=A0ABU7N6J1_PSEVI|nr:type VI secretion system tip protein TssI/VgrG [Pseudomonas viridiflava]MEE4040567.1 type VI secretion system tip protein TssI/VgrG [Pseudomonas viridiflava]MEE4060781.1 type VI secretion system tip protein TssI/VgrG [Pseudomonas viridiflava]MEE4170358.1 type VI secretion system tip protein TssI/VgrG [Pseudomonas viridiflava]
MLKDLTGVFAPQNRRLIKLTTVARDEQELLLEEFSGTEGLSELFSFELSMISRDAGLELKSQMGQPAQLEIELATGEVRHIHGYISEFGLQGSDGGIAHYRAILSPWLWMLSRRVDSRIFQDQTIEDVLRKVFTTYGALADFEFHVSQPLTPHSYITQYRENDLDFVLRLMEHEGLFFYFDHKKDAHTLIITDQSQPLSPLTQQPVIRYHSASVTETSDSITEWSSNRVLQPGRLSIQTFDYKQPRNRLPVSMPSLNAQGNADSYEVYDFLDHYSHATPSDGEHLVRHRLEAIEVLAKSFKGSSNCRAMCPGYTFELTQHFDHDNGSAEDRRFLLLKVEHQGRNNYLTDDDAGYSNQFVCIRHKIPYRHPITVPRPTVPGPLSATVVGPEGEEVFTDELARIQVRFHWQRGDTLPQGTTWVRIAMPSAGGGFGHQFLPRIGQEVLVTFMAGDIDRPLVTSVLYNADNTPPSFSKASGLPGNRTLSGIKTQEHKGSGFNELLFDDTPGALRARMGTTHHASALNLGKLTDPRSDGTAQPRGNGAELRTDAAIALRAAQGMLLTTYARQDAKGSQLDREELLKLLAECGELFKSLGETAAARGGQAVDPLGIEALRQSLNQWPTPDSNGTGDPVLAVTAEAGIASATPRSQAHYAGENHDTTAQNHLQMTSGAAMHLQAGKGISAFAQDAGISAIANRGKVLVQAQEDDIALNAQKNLHASAVEGEVVITAPTIRLVADDGSYIKIGGGIEIGSQSKVTVHASEHDWVGPKTDSAPIPAFGRDPAAQRLAFHYPGHSETSPRAAADHAYEIKLKDGSMVKGKTDTGGLTERVEREMMHQAQVSALRSGTPKGGAQ